MAPGREQRLAPMRTKRNGTRRRKQPTVASRSRRRALALATGAAASLIALGLLWSALQRANRIGGPFNLVNGTGHTVSNQNFLGKYELIYFGYTHCPDICPLTLSRIAATLHRLGSAARDVVPIFITIDPERDKPEVIRHYTREFSDRIVGLTGSPRRIARVAREFHVYYRREPVGSDNADYTMDHSTSLYVIGPAGRFITALRSPASAAELTVELKRLLGDPMSPREDNRRDSERPPAFPESPAPPVGRRS